MPEKQVIVEIYDEELNEKLDTYKMSESAYKTICWFIDEYPSTPYYVKKTDKVDIKELTF